MTVWYFDNASTTPVDPRVADRMATCMTADGCFANPASTTHGFGWQASEEIEWARETVASTIGADPREIVFTSGATEADNLAIRGVYEALAESSGRHRVITLASEHKAVLDTCHHLPASADCVVLKPMPDGQIDWSAFDAALTAQTLLVSVMLVNNETGVIQDLARVSALAKARGALVHSDLAQAIGKCPVHVAHLGLDLASLSAHKTYGPKGIGALYVRRSPEVRIAEQQHGGQHERGMRSGTLPTHQIVGMAEAYRLAAMESDAETAQIAEYRQQIVDCCEALGGIHVNGAGGVPHILNVTVDGVDAEPLMAAMPEIAISTGSACNSATLEPSHVLQSMGLSRQEGLSSIRISFGRMTSTEAITDFVACFRRAVTGLREAT